MTVSDAGGGGYNGQVQITAEAIAPSASNPNGYPAQYVTATVKPGPNSVTITMGSTPTKKSTGLPWTLIFVIAVLIIAVIAVVAVLAYAMKHGKKRRR